MCTLQSAPPLALVWPWQEPWSWVGSAVALLVVAACAMLGAHALRHPMSTLKRSAGWVLLVVASLALSVGLFPLLLVVLPGYDLAQSWPQQVAQGCSSVLWQLPWTQDQLPLERIQNATFPIALIGIAALAVLGSLYPLYGKSSVHQHEERSKSGVSN